MKKKVIVCDSGMSERHLRLVHSIDIGMGWKDDNGHGSKMIDVIHLIVPEAEIISIKVLDKNKECTLEDLLSALTRCSLLEGEAVVCLAMAIADDVYVEPIAEKITSIARSRKVIVSSVFNSFSESFPASLPEVIGVCDCDELKLSDKFYNSQNQIQCRLPYIKIVVEGLENNYTPFGGNSLLCALLVTQILSLMENAELFDLPTVEKQLNMQRLRDLFYYRFFLNKDILACENETIKEKITEILQSLGYDKNKSLVNQIKSIQDLNLLFITLKNNHLAINHKRLFELDYIENMSTLVQYFS